MRMIRSACAVMLVLTGLSTGAVFAAPATQPATASSESVVLRAYDVADLVGAEMTLEAIQDQIVAAVGAENWADAGPGTIERAEGKALVINQTADAHRQVQQALNSLRQSRGVQIIVETQLLSIAAAKLPAKVYDPATKQIGGDYLGDADVKALMDLCKSDPKASLVAAPRVTISDGAEANVEVITTRNYRSATATTRPNGTQAYTLTDEEAWDGVRLKIGGKASDDRKHVRLQFDLEVQRILGMNVIELKPADPADRPITIEQPMVQTISIVTHVAARDGGTLLLGGQTLAEGKEQEKQSERVLLVLVKPRIVVPRPATQPALSLLHAQ